MFLGDIFWVWDIFRSDPVVASYLIGIFLGVTRLWPPVFWDIFGVTRLWPPVCWEILEFESLKYFPI